MFQIGFYETINKSVLVLKIFHTSKCKLIIFYIVKERVIGLMRNSINTELDCVPACPRVRWDTN